MLKFEIADCYVVGKDYFEGITKKKDLFNTLAIFKASQKIFCKNIIEKSGYEFIQHEGSCCGDGSVSLGQAIVASQYL